MYLNMFDFRYRNESEYKPAAGEILAKDSILYSQQPGSGQLRRQLWPIMEKTLSNIIGGVSVGANILKRFITKPKKEQYQLPKIRQIKNVYLSPSSPIFVSSKTQIHNQRPAKYVSQIKSPSVIIEKKPVNTIADEYIFTFSDTPINKINPYADMGVTGYKHFEETVLRELEEKEEKKVEATMNTLYNKGLKKTAEFIGKIPHSDWVPVNTESTTFSDPPRIQKPYPVDVLHTNIVELGIRPVHEEVVESFVPEELKPVSEEKVRNLTYTFPRNSKLSRNQYHKALPSTQNSTNNSSVRALLHTLEDPNLPDLYLKNNQHLLQAIKSPNAGTYKDSMYSTEDRSAYKHRFLSLNKPEKNMLMEPLASASFNRVVKNQTRSPNVKRNKEFAVEESLNGDQNLNTPTGPVRGSIKFMDRL